MVLDILKKKVQCNAIKAHISEVSKKILFWATKSTPTMYTILVCLTTFFADCKVVKRDH